MTDPIDGVEQSARHTARLRADELRAMQRKLDRRHRWLLRGGIIGGIVAVVAVVAIVLVGFVRPPGRGPANMASDGIVIGRQLKAERTPGLAGDADPVPTPRGRDVVRIQVWVDYFQPNSAAFTKANGAQLRQWAESGAATVEVHPIALAASGPDGGQYSIRAANAAACVAQFSPDRFVRFSQALVVAQPAQTTSGLDADAIIRIARDAKVTRLGEVSGCIRSMRFERWVRAASQRATTGPLPGTKLDAVTATPTVIIDGVPWDAADPSDSQGLGQAFVAALGDSFSDAPTSSPTPSPSPSPSATPAG